MNDTDCTDPEKKHVPARQREDLEKQKGRLPPGEEVTRSVYVLPFENSLFFSSHQNFKAEQSFSICGLIISDRSGSEEAERSQRSEASKLSGAQERSDKVERSHAQERSDELERTQRSEATKLSGAQMPEQRRAGQLSLSIKQ